MHECNMIKLKLLEDLKTLKGGIIHGYKFPKYR